MVVSNGRINETEWMAKAKFPPRKRRRVAKAKPKGKKGVCDQRAALKNPTPSSLVEELMDPILPFSLNHDHQCGNTDFTNVDQTLRDDADELMQTEPIFLKCKGRAKKGRESAKRRLPPFPTQTEIEAAEVKRGSIPPHEQLRKI